MTETNTLAEEIPMKSENPAADALLPDEDLLCDLAELF